MAEQQYQQKRTYVYVDRVQSGERSLESLQELEQDIKSICTSGEPPYMVTKEVNEIYQSICEALTLLQS